MSVTSLLFRHCRHAALALVMLTQALPAAALGLLEAYDLALKNDPVYRSARHERDAGSEAESIGRSALLPSVSATYSRSKNKAEITSTNVFGAPTRSEPEYTSEAAALSVRQPLFNLDGVARYRQGVAQAQYSDAQFSGRTQELLLRLVSAYLQALYAQDQLALSIAQRDTFVEQKQVNDRMFVKGEGTRTEMLETQSRLDLAEAQLIEARDNHANALAALAGIIGREVRHLDGLKDAFHAGALQVASFEEWKRIALEHNAEIVAQRYLLQSAREEINKNRAAHMPRLDMVAGLSRSNSETVTTYNQSSSVRSVGLQLNVPLYSGGYASAVTRQAVASHERAKADLDAKTDKVLLELRKQHALMQSSFARIAALAKAVDSAQLLVLATQQSVKGGIRINLDVLSAQQQLYSAKKDLAQARYSYLLSYLNLKNAAGTLAAEDLTMIATYFGA